MRSEKHIISKQEAFQLIQNWRESEKPNQDDEVNRDFLILCEFAFYLLDNTGTRLYTYIN